VRLTPKQRKQRYAQISQLLAKYGGKETLVRAQKLVRRTRETDCVSSNA
jgi:hypothetical protein